VETLGERKTMSMQNRNRDRSLRALALICAICCTGVAQAQEATAPAEYDVVAPPACTNDKGETVRFVDSERGGAAIAAGMARRDGDGNPVVIRSNYAAAPPDFQKFIDRHECAHHQTGDVDRPHPPRNGPEHLMNESISDCVAILRLRDEDGYDQAGFDRVVEAMRGEMERIGFPEISIASRISNITNCYANYGAPRDFIDGVLERRGLLKR
jgi:hypothetical protein